MAWKETCVMDERMAFIVDWRRDEMKVAALCRLYGISRKTGHKWIERFKAEGMEGLKDRSRAPHHHPNAVGETEEALRQAQLAVLRNPQRVRQRTKVLLADAGKRGLSEKLLRGVKGKLATDLPEGGKIESAPTRSPEAWWAAFVLSGDWR